jgi:hydrogenase expression/formation protein HypC
LCLAVPAKVVKIEGDHAEVEIGGIRREASIALLSGEGIAVGDYVLIHTGYAISKVDEEEARAILATWRQVMEAEMEP